MISWKFTVVLYKGLRREDRIYSYLVGQSYIEHLLADDSPLEVIRLTDFLRLVTRMSAFVWLNVLVYTSLRSTVIILVIISRWFLNTTVFFRWWLRWWFPLFLITIFVIIIILIVVVITRFVWGLYRCNLYRQFVRALNCVIDRTCRSWFADWLGNIVDTRNHLCYAHFNSVRSVDACFYYTQLRRSPRSTKPKILRSLLYTFLLVLNCD